MSERIIYHDSNVIVECPEVRKGKFKKKDDPQLRKFMHDFSCATPNDMNYTTLAQKTRYFKEDDKWGTHMCRIMEEIKAQGFAEGREEARELAMKNTLRMLKYCKLSIDEIAGYTNLSV